MILCGKYSPFGHSVTMEFMFSTKTAPKWYEIVLNTNIFQIPDSITPQAICGLQCTKSVAKQGLV